MSRYSPSSRKSEDQVPLLLSTPQPDLPQDFQDPNQAIQGGSITRQEEEKQSTASHEEGTCFQSYPLKHADQFQQLNFLKELDSKDHQTIRLYFQTPTGHLMHGTKEGETDSLLQQRASYQDLNERVDFELEDEANNERLPQRRRLSTLIKRYKRYKIAMLLLILFHFFLDYTLCYFIYNYIDAFRPYLVQIFKTQDLDQIIFIIRMLVILDFSFQLIFLYVTSILALVKDETQSYFMLQVGIIVSMVTKLLLSYLVIFYLLCFLLRVGLLSLTRYLKNLVINILYTLRQRPIREIL